MFNILNLTFIISSEDCNLESFVILLKNAFKTVFHISPLHPLTHHCPLFNFFMSVSPNTLLLLLETYFLDERRKIKYFIFTLIYSFFDVLLLFMQIQVFDLDYFHSS